MAQDFDAQEKVHITRDAQGTARNLLHIEETYESTASTALLAAREYLDKSGDGLGIRPAELANCSLSPEAEPIDPGVEYRFEQEKSQFDSTTVEFSQTMFGLRIWEAGAILP